MELEALRSQELKLRSEAYRLEGIKRNVFSSDTAKRHAEGLLKAVYWDLNLARSKIQAILDDESKPITPYADFC